MMRCGIPVSIGGESLHSSVIDDALIPAIDGDCMANEIQVEIKGNSCLPGAIMPNLKLCITGNGFGNGFIDSLVANISLKWSKWVLREP